jgi:hypothetical protein
MVVKREFVVALMTEAAQSFCNTGIQPSHYGATIEKTTNPDSDDLQ